MVTPLKYTELKSLVNQAVELGHDDPLLGLSALTNLYHELSGLGRRELNANDGQLRGLSHDVSREIIDLYSVLGEYEKALAHLDDAGWIVNGNESSRAIHIRAFLLYNVGQDRAAGNLVYGLIRDATEPTFLALPTDFFEILRYRQLDLARNWLDEKRVPERTTPEWLKPKGLSLLYRLEAQLFLEEGQHERVIVAYDKAFHADTGKNVYPNGISEDLIMAGRPNLGLRLLGSRAGDVSEKLWKAIALRMLGKTDTADPILEAIAGTEIPTDEFHIQTWALASCYADNAVTDVAAELDNYMEEGADFEDVLQYTIGVVNGVLGRGEKARNAFARAVTLARRLHDGHLLNRERWFHVQELFSPTLLEEVREYFDPTLMPVRYL